jgi:hypothetical protein
MDLVCRYLYHPKKHNDGDGFENGCTTRELRSFEEIALSYSYQRGKHASYGLNYVRSHHRWTCVSSSDRILYIEREQGNSPCVNYILMHKLQYRLKLDYNRLTSTINIDQQPTHSVLLSQ